MNTSIIPMIVAELEAISDDDQKRVLEFIESLKSSAKRGVPGKNLLRFAGAIPPDDLFVMQETIESGCEQVNLNEW